MSSISEIIKESLKFPTENLNALLIVGVLFVVTSLNSIIARFDIYNAELSLILFIVSLIVGILLAGYALSLIKVGIHESDIPELNIINNFIDGLKSILLNVVYFIVPVIITLIVVVETLPFDKSVLTQLSPLELINILPIDLLIIYVIVFLVLVFIFGLFYYVGLARFAETDKLSEGLSFSDVIKDIGTIGWGKYIGWAIVNAIVAFLLVFLRGIVSLIPYVGDILVALLISSFILFFYTRSLGLIYSNRNQD